MEWDQVVPQYYDDMILSSTLFIPPIEAVKEVKKKSSLNVYASEILGAVGLNKTANKINTSIRECQICGFKAATLKGLRRHNRIKHRVNACHKCMFCSQVFGKSLPLKKHILRKHGNEKLYTCDSCDFGAPLKSVLKKHSADVHQKKQTLQCSKCEFTSSSRLGYKNHMLSHSKSRCCVQCSFRTRTLRDLKHHIKVKHENMKELSCHICDFRTVHTTSLRVHLDAKHDRNQFTDCPYCDYCATRPENMNRHILAKHFVVDQLAVRSGEKDADMGENISNKDTRSTGPKRKIKRKRGRKRSSIRVGIKIGKNKNKLHAMPIHGSYESVFENPSSQIDSEALGTLPETELSLEKCTECDFTCMDKDSLSKHFHIFHFTQGSGNCRHCEFTSDNSSNLQRHVSAEHTRDGIVSCQNSLEDDGLTEHSRAIANQEEGQTPLTPPKTQHNITEMLQCPQCEFQTKFYFDLERHFHVHTKELLSPEKSVVEEPIQKRRKSGDSEVISSSEFQLDVHLKMVHTDECREFSCPMCEYTTSHLRVLRKHITTKHFAD